MEVFGIDECLKLHCRLFAEDQYFDSQGMFITTVLSLPVIINCCVIVVRKKDEVWWKLLIIISSSVFGYMNPFIYFDFI